VARGPLRPTVTFSGFGFLYRPISGQVDLILANNEALTLLRHFARNAHFFVLIFFLRSLLTYKPFKIDHTN